MGSENGVHRFVIVKGKMGTTQLTPAQVEHWKKYERVRKGGRFNMYDPRAREATGLNGEQYEFVMRNYAALKLLAAEENP